MIGRAVPKRDTMGNITGVCGLRGSTSLLKGTWKKAHNIALIAVSHATFIDTFFTITALFGK